MSLLVRHNQALFERDQELHVVASGRQFLRLQAVERGDLGVVRVNKHAVAGQTVGVRDQGNGPEVRHVHISRAVDGRHTLARNFRTNVRNTGEGRELLLVGRTHVSLRRRSAVGERRSEHRLHQSFRKGALGAIGSRRDDTSGETAVRTGFRGVCGQERQKARALAGRGAGFHNGSEVADKTHFKVALDLDGLQHLLAGQFAIASGLVYDFLRARNAAGLGDDLHVVADAGRQVGGAEGVVITFKLGIGRNRGCQRFRLPLVIDVRRLRRAEVGDQRRGFRGNTIDRVLQVFTDTDVDNRGSDGTDGVCRSGHVLSLSG